MVGHCTLSCGRAAVLATACKQHIYIAIFTVSQDSPDPICKILQCTHEGVSSFCIISLFNLHMHACANEHAHRALDNETSNFIQLYTCGSVSECSNSLVLDICNEFVHMYEPEIQGPTGRFAIQVVRWQHIEIRTVAYMARQGKARQCKAYRALAHEHHDRGTLDLRKSLFWGAWSWMFTSRSWGHLLKLLCLSLLTQAWIVPSFLQLQAKSKPKAFIQVATINRAEIQLVLI